MLSKPLLWIRQLYDWVLKWSDHKYNIYVLSGLTAIEAIFFPIPTDPLLIAMGISRPKKALFYAFINTLASVGGAFIGYWVGALFWHITQDFFFTYVFSQEVFNLVVAKFNENAFLAIFLASFTPLPFKVFTVSAGVATLSIPTFLLAAIIGRGARFFILSGLIFFFGAPIKIFIDKHFNSLVLGFSALGILGFYLVPYVLR